MTGKDIIVTLSQGGVALANTRIKSQDAKTACEVIEKASSTQQDWKEYVPGRKSWTLAINYLYMASSQILDLLYVGQTFDVTIKDTGNNTSVTGSAIMTAVGNVATVGNLATGSFSLQGSGALSVPVSNT